MRRGVGLLAGAGNELEREGAAVGLSLDKQCYASRGKAERSR